MLYFSIFDLNERVATLPPLIGEYLIRRHIPANIMISIRHIITNILVCLYLLCIVRSSVNRGHTSRISKANSRMLQLSLRKIGRAAASCLIIANMNEHVGIKEVSAKVMDEVSSKRFQSSLEELKNLDKNWAKYSNNGDDIRRVLGTVYSTNGCTSPLCSPEAFIKKFVRNNLDELDYDTFEVPSR